MSSGKTFAFIGAEHEEHAPFVSTRFSVLVVNEAEKELAKSTTFETIEEARAFAERMAEKVTYLTSADPYISQDK
ncbi:hypothetical protein [Oryzifoliimicrobium ureilyticus]|uniref:hypothetical protein n=1 Tax=Oryzifoliimicrobium ureilyticus TaxID=3113724 RepID=UPI0030767C2A